MDNRGRATSPRGYHRTGGISRPSSFQVEVVHFSPKVGKPCRSHLQHISTHSLQFFPAPIDKAGKEAQDELRSLFPPITGLFRKDEQEKSTALKDTHGTVPASCLLLIFLHPHYAEVMVNHAEHGRVRQYSASWFGRCTIILCHAVTFPMPLVPCAGA